MLTRERLGVRTQRREYRNRTTRRIMAETGSRDDDVRGEKRANNLGMRGKSTHGDRKTELPSQEVCSERRRLTLPRVLVVDDEPSMRALLVDMLLEAGYDVVEASDGVAALEQARREHPDIMLLDALMPVMDGFQVIRRLRENPTWGSMPVIMLTGLSEVEGELSDPLFYRVHYLNKPCRRATLELTIEHALREAE